MAKKKFYAILDTESTIEDTAADFAIVICDKNGEIHDQIAVLVEGHYGTHELWHDKKNPDAEIWGKRRLEHRHQAYRDMLQSGKRMVASVQGINDWINRAIGKYNPELTAYNLNFDERICKNTEIDLTGFSNRFCLWQAAVGNICQTRKYLQFVLDNHLFNNRTEKGNLTFLTNAEAVCGYLNGQYGKEPHTALEDARDWELPIVKAIVSKRNWQAKIVPYGWAAHQMRDHFKVA